MLSESIPLCACGCGAPIPPRRTKAGLPNIWLTGHNLRGLSKGNHLIFAPIHISIWAYVKRGPDCWTWLGTQDGRGYGRIRWDGHTWLAHRAMWILQVGVIPDGLFVLHTCDNPSCLRADEPGQYFANGKWHPQMGHLWLGTAKDNTADMIAKGRSRFPWRGRRESIPDPTILRQPPDEFSRGRLYTSRSAP